VGEQARWIAEAAEEEGMDPAHVLRFLDREEAVLELRKILKENDRILIKASRGMRLEQIVEELKN
jgi:UDP-N-acetylmuramoyl-tripeptide--D-alanyl-D-alanine ligase